jgi:acyl-CoA synthetase (NDP forming)
MDTFFNPTSVAVVGASNNIRKAGHVIFKNFAENERRGVFKGKLYPVNIHEDLILGHQSFSFLSEIPGEVDLVVIVTPAATVHEVMKDAAKKDVKSVVIISAGFSEIGNYSLQDSIVSVAKANGMRVLGPNCLGVFDTITGVDMLFLPETKILTSGDEFIATPRPMAGQIAIITQSGAFGVSALDYLTGRQMGISKFVSFGNKCDVAEAEMLTYLLHDEKTWVILLYAEAIEAGREFMEVADKVTRRKPIVAFKSGRTDAGARAAVSHTGAMAGSDKIYDAAFAQVGVVRVQNMEEFFDVGKAFAFQPPALGNNIGILTDAGGPSVMAVDECESKGLTINRFSEEVFQRFEVLKQEGKLPRFATTINPVDITGSATSEMFEHSAKIFLEAPEIKGLIVLGLHHTPALQEDFVDRVARLTSQTTKPVVACDIGETEMAMFIRSRFEKYGIPAFSSPEDAARAMAGLVHYGEYLNKIGSFEDYMEIFARRHKSST